MVNPARALAPFAVVSAVPFILCAAAIADLKLDPLFSPHAVLQRMRPIPVEGRASPGARVEVEFGGPKGAKVSGTAGADGRFSVVLPAMPASREPATLAVRSAGDEILVGDILVGDVWFCSGQSNMEWPIDAADGADKAREIAPTLPIRSFKAPHVTANTPAETVPGGWRVANASTVGSFTAVGFWFGAMLARERGVPIGLVDISWGGTRIEPWIPLDSMARSDFKDRADALAAQIAEFAKTAPEARAAAQEREVERFRAARAEYWTKAVAGENEGRDQAWWDSSSWATTTLPAYYPAVDRVLEGFDGFVWFTREFEVPAAMAGKPCVLRLPAIDDGDLVTIDGAEVGSTVGDWNTPRAYEIARGLSAGKHRITIGVLDMHGQGGFAPGRMSIGTGAAGAEIALDGEWRWRKGGGVPRGGVPAMRDVNKAPGTEPHEPAAIYNAMMAPCIRFPAEGVIWYQGESNAGEPEAYRKLLPLLAQSWREKSGNRDLKWGVVQLAAFMKHDANAPVQRGWAELREAQYRGALEIGGGMASAIDLGDADDIHPRRKREVGERLAMWAQATVDGGDAWRGPELREARRDGRAVRVSFSFAEKGLVAVGGAPQGFALRGADGKWSWATARVDGSSVVVESDAVAEPTGVAYAWQNFPKANLADDAGLPMVPFKVEFAEAAPGGAR